MKEDKVQTTRQPLSSLTGGAGGRSSSFGGDDIDNVILNGVTFKGGGKHPKKDEAGKVKTKAKKKSYITGTHGSASAKKKADIRRARANRHK